ASSTLSSTVSLGNRLVTWNVRAMPSAVRRWLGQSVTSRPNRRICPELAGWIPVMTLKRVVLPAPLGPMTALRSPGRILRSTPRTAWSPPKLLYRPMSSRTGVTASCICWSTRASLQGLGPEPARRAPASGGLLFAEFTRRIVAAVHRRLEELVLLELPELIDVRVGLDDRIPELLLVVAEHLLLLDFLDVDVLHRIAHLIDAHGSAHRVQFEGGELLDELVRARVVAFVLLHDLVDHLRGGVVR